MRLRRALAVVSAMAAFAVALVGVGAGPAMAANCLAQNVHVQRQIPIHPDICDWT